MPDLETDVEMPVEDAVEQEQLVASPVEPDNAAGTSAGTPAAGDGAPIEADEADLAEQRSVVGYDDEDYR